MHFGFVFLAATAFVAGVGSIPTPSQRTYGAPHNMHHHHGHGGHHHNVFPGHGHLAISPGHTVLAADGSSLTVLVCRPVKIPLASIGSKQQALPVTNSRPPASMASSVLTSSQQVLRNITTRVRTAVDRLVDPVFAALQNASLWLNRTSQIPTGNQNQHVPHQLPQHQHVPNPHQLPQHQQPHQHVPHPHQLPQHQQPHQHVPHPHQLPQDQQQQQHVHVLPANIHPLHLTNFQALRSDSAHDQQMLRVIPQDGVPMAVVSIPVLVPAAQHGSGFEFFNLTTGVPVNVGQGQEATTAQLSTASSFATATVPPLSTVRAGADDELLGRTAFLPTAPATEISDVPASATFPESTPSSSEVTTFPVISDPTVDVTTSAPTASEPFTSEPCTSEPEVLSTDTPESAPTTLHL